MNLRTLYQTLLDSDPARLRIIAQQWGVTLQATRHTDIAAELADALAHGAAVEQALDDLSPPQRAALDDLLRHEGAIPWATFERRWGEVRAVGMGKVEREELWREPASATEGLWLLGLIQRAFADYEHGPVEMAYVPEELRLYMPAPPPRDLPDVPPAQPPLHISQGDDALADDLVTVWAFLQTSTTSTRHQRERLLQKLHPPADLRLELLETLALGEGWIRKGRGERYRLVADPVLEWLGADLWAQWESLARAWQGSRRWNDLAHVPTLRPDPVKGWLEDAQGARSRLLEMVQRCQPATWYTLEAFTDYIYRYATDFLRPHGNYNLWAPRDARTDVPLRGFDAWHAVEGALIRFIVTGPLTWLGWVDLGSSAPQAPPVAFRLTPAGAAFLGLTTPPEFAEPPPVQLESGGTMCVPARRRYERFQLSRVAQPVSWRSGYCYRLTPDSLARARRQKIPAERIIGFLNEAAGQKLPNPLQRAIRRAYEETSGSQQAIQPQGSAAQTGLWEAGQERGARLEQVWLLQVPSPELLQAPALRALVQAQLAPDVAVIRALDRDRVLDILTENGVLAEVKGD